MLKSLVAYVLDWIVTRLVALFVKAEKQREADKSIDQETKKQADAIKRAETEDELEQAAKEILSRK